MGVKAAKEVDRGVINIPIIHVTTKPPVSPGADSGSRSRIVSPLSDLETRLRRSVSRGSDSESSLTSVSPGPGSDPVSRTIEIVCDDDVRAALKVRQQQQKEELKKRLENEAEQTKQLKEKMEKEEMRRQYR